MHDAFHPVASLGDVGARRTTVRPTIVSTPEETTPVDFAPFVRKHRPAVDAGGGSGVALCRTPEGGEAARPLWEVGESRDVALSSQTGGADHAIVAVESVLRCCPVDR